MFEILEFKVFYKGREVLLVLEKDVGFVFVFVCDYIDVMYFVKVSDIVCREMFIEYLVFLGYFNRDYIVDFVLCCLVEFVLMIEYRFDIKF